MKLMRRDAVQVLRPPAREGPLPALARAEVGAQRADAIDAAGQTCQDQRRVFRRICAPAKRERWGRNHRNGCHHSQKRDLLHRETLFRRTSLRLDACSKSWAADAVTSLDRCTKVMGFRIRSQGIGLVLPRYLRASFGAEVRFARTVRRPWATSSAAPRKPPPSL